MLDDDPKGTVNRSAGPRRVCGDPFTLAREALAEASATLTAGHVHTRSRVHTARKALKRFRAHVRLLAPLLVSGEARRLRHQAAQIARSLAEERDEEAAHDVLAQLTGREMDPPAGARRPRLDHVSTSVEIDALRATFEASIRGSAGDRAIVSAVVATYRKARRAAPDSRRRADAERLHELRKRVVVLRHQLDLVKPLDPRGIGRMITRAQRLRESLGRHQDLEVLETRLPQADRRRLKRAIAVERAALMLKIEADLETTFEARPRDLRGKWLAGLRNSKNAPIR